MSTFLSGQYEGYAFSIAGSTGVIAAGLAAASEIFQFRWSNTHKSCRILQVNVSAAVDATAFTAGAGLFDMTVARAWTADGSGGTTLTPSGNSNKLRTIQNAFDQGGTSSCRVATVGALTAGTKTLDGQPIGNMAGGCAAAGTPILFPAPIYVDWSSYGIPLVLANQEGFVIRASVPATGVWKASINVLAALID